MGGFGRIEQGGLGCVLDRSSRAAPSRPRRPPHRRRWSCRCWRATAGLVGGRAGWGGSSRGALAPPSLAFPSPPASSSSRRRPFFPRRLHRSPPSPAYDHSREATTARRCVRWSAPPGEAVLLCTTGASAYYCFFFLQMRDDNPLETILHIKEIPFNSLQHQSTPPRHYMFNTKESPHTL